MTEIQRYSMFVLAGDLECEVDKEGHWVRFSDYDQLKAENERMRKALRYEQHLAEHIGTHGPDCWAWGPAHYECLKRRYQLVNLSGYVEVME